MTPSDTVVAFPNTPSPPAYLDPKEAEVWRAVMASQKAGHFGPEIFPVLESYCTTALICDRMAARLRIDESNDRLLASSDEATASLLRLAQALGLLPEGEREAMVG